LLSCDQISKLQLGRSRFVVSTFDHYQLVQFNYAPLVLTFIAQKEVCTEHVIQLGSELSAGIDLIRQRLNHS
jgi:mitogen-activated protein kinase kinase 1 interacting protein 1